MNLVASAFRRLAPESSGAEVTGSGRPGENCVAFLKTRLGAMMFLNYVIWGSWYVTITTYLTTTLHFTGTQAGAVFSTASIAAIISPFFVGLVADRFFATERVLSVLYFLGAILMYLVTTATTFGAVY